MKTYKVTCIQSKTIVLSIQQSTGDYKELRRATKRFNFEAEQLAKQWVLEYWPNVSVEIK